MMLGKCEGGCEGECGMHCWCKVVIRVLVAAIFIYAGYNKLTGIDATAGAISSVMAWPAATFFAWVSGLIEFVGGILLVIGYFKKWAGWALIVLTIIATYYFHLKGAMGGESMQWIQVLKNLAIIGGLAMIAGCCRRGSGETGGCGPEGCGHCEGGKCGGEEKKSM